MTSTTSKVMAASLILLFSLPPTNTLVAQSASLRQSFDLLVPKPPAPITIMGRQQLVYELHLTNFAREALVLRQIEILDAVEGGVISTLSGTDLDNRLHQGGVLLADSVRGITPGMRTVVYIELTLDEHTLPAALNHRVTYLAADGEDHPAAVVQGARVPINAAAPIVLGPPLRDGPWAAVYHPSWERGHRRVVYAVGGRARIPGRHAVDFMMVDSAGFLANGDPDSVHTYYGHGEDVLAVADAVVSAARNNVAESATVSGNPRPVLEDATGNYVTLDLGDGRYVFYEHLLAGSVRVQPGDNVKRGQVIASVGFTGSATAPHLHLHVADANSPLGAEGVPFVIDRFSLLGTYEDFAAFGNGPWTRVQSSIRRMRIEEMPAPNSVIEFPD